MQILLAMQSKSNQFAIVYSAADHLSREISTLTLSGLMKDFLVSTNPDISVLTQNRHDLVNAYYVRHENGF